MRSENFRAFKKVSHFPSFFPPLLLRTSNDYICIRKTAWPQTRPASLTATVHPSKGSKSILLSKWTPWLPAVQWSLLYPPLLPSLMLLKIFISKLTPGKLLQLLLQVLRHPGNCVEHHRAAFQCTREQKHSIRALRVMVLLPTCTVLLKYMRTGGNA